MALPQGRRHAPGCFRTPPVTSGGNPACPANAVFIQRMYSVCTSGAVLAGQSNSRPESNLLFCGDLPIVNLSGIRLALTPCREQRRLLASGIRWPSLNHIPVNTAEGGHVMSTLHQTHTTASTHALGNACLIAMTIGFAAIMALPAVAAIAMLGM